MEIQNALPVKLSNTVADGTRWKVYSQLLCLLCLLAFSNAWGQSSYCAALQDACSITRAIFRDCTCTCKFGWLGEPACDQTDGSCPLAGSCGPNEHVVFYGDDNGDGYFDCAACPDGTTNEACDHPSLNPDGSSRTWPLWDSPTVRYVITDCDVTPSVCDDNQYVSSGTCEACPAGTVNPAGDDPSGGDTSCALVIECVGFEPPMNNYPVGVKKNRALPLKAELFSVNGVQTDAELTAPPLIQVVFDGDSEPAQDVSGDALSAGQGSEGNQFLFTNDGKWQFNLQTDNYTAPGSYAVYMESGDDTAYVIDPTCETGFTIK